MKIYVGTSGWSYPDWEGVLYPKSLKSTDQLAFASRKMTSIEVNNTFYRLLRPHVFQSWYDDTPNDFKFSIKGGKFVTHVLKLDDCYDALANFFASGILSLREKLGPILWQFPPSLEYQASHREFFETLPRTFSTAAKLAQNHTKKVAGNSLTKTDFTGPIHHVIEIRNPSFLNPEMQAIIKSGGIAIAFTDSGDLWPRFSKNSGPIHYARLHAPLQLYPQGYTRSDLTNFLVELTSLEHQESIKEVYVYFDNGNKKTAPANAMEFQALANARIGAIVS